MQRLRWYQAVRLSAVYVKGKNMISNQMIQTSLDELKAITKVDLSVYEPGGMLAASTSVNADITEEMIVSFAESLAAAESGYCLQRAI